MDKKFIGLFQHVEQLHSQELYESVVTTANILLSAWENLSEDIAVLQRKYETWFYYADSLHHLEEYRKAEEAYRRCLQVKKNGFKLKSLEKQVPEEEEKISEAEIKYKIHLCLLKLKQKDDAVTVLQGIPYKQRTPKVNMALAKLLQDTGNDRAAISLYKEVLRDSPLALDAALALLSLGVKSVDIHALILDGAPFLHSHEWFPHWIDGHASIHLRDYQEALNSFNKLDNRAVIPDNVEIIVTMGEIHAYRGDYTSALITLKRAQMLDPLMQHGLDLLAAMSYRLSRGKEIVKYLNDRLLPEEYKPEHWVTLGYYSYVNKKYTRAAYFAQKALFLKPQQIEALILKGMVLLELKKYEYSVEHFREAMQIAPYRFEIYAGLIENYVGQKRIREACGMCSNMAKSLGQTPRTLTLYASVLLKDPTQTSKAKSLLEKALAEDERHLPAVYLLVELYEQELQTSAAIDLLEKHTQIQPNAKIYQMLGDLYSRINDEGKALEHYNFALALDPTNRQAIEGMHRIDNTSSKMETYYMSVGEEEVIDSPYEPVPDSDNEEDEEAVETDTEVLWSDMDLETSSQ